MKKSPEPIDDESGASGRGPSNREGGRATAASISSNNARGAADSGEGTSGDTLLPMLVGGLALIIIGVIVVFLLA